MWVADIEAVFLKNFDYFFGKVFLELIKFLPFNNSSSNLIRNCRNL